MFCYLDQNQIDLNVCLVSLLSGVIHFAGFENCLTNFHELAFCQPKLEICHLMTHLILNYDFVDAMDEKFWQCSYCLFDVDAVCYQALCS